MQEFIDHLDMMPSITMENNVIHNNEGYGVIVVKPNNEERKASVDASEGMWRSAGNVKLGHIELFTHNL